jgi:membrane-bound lytic murein transglycosylase MltF
LKFYKNNIARLIKKHKTLIFLFIVCFIFLYPKRIADYSTSFDFVQDGCIIFALGTDNNAYFLNNGQVLGYHFELMKKYCHTTEQQPVFVIEEDIDKRMDLLLANKVDIIACDAKTDSIYQLKNVNSIYIDKNFSQDIWTVNDKNSGLAKNINLWLSAYIDTKEYRFLSAKYNRKVNYNKPHTHISNYDDLIRKYSEKINWDWRLTASLIYQESQFNPAVI